MLFLLRSYPSEIRILVFSFLEVLFSRFLLPDHENTRCASHLVYIAHKMCVCSMLNCIIPGKKEELELLNRTPDVHPTCFACEWVVELELGDIFRVSLFLSLI